MTINIKHNKKPTKLTQSTFNQNLKTPLLLAGSMTDSCRAGVEWSLFSLHLDNQHQLCREGSLPPPPQPPGSEAFTAALWARLADFLRSPNLEEGQEPNCVLLPDTMAVTVM